MMQGALQLKLSKPSNPLGKMRRMGIRDVPLTEYVKKRLRDATKGDGGAKLVELEMRAEVSKGFFSQVLGGSSGVGPTTARGIAKIFGFKNENELRNAAWRDWEDGGGRQAYELVATPEKHPDPEVARAIVAARAANVAHESIQEALREYPNVTNKPWDWWVSRIGEHVRSTDVKLRNERTIERKKNKRRKKTPESGPLPSS